MRVKIPVYAEVKPNKAFMSYIRDWLKSRGIKPDHLLVAKPNLVIAVLPSLAGKTIICFYVQKLCSLINGGVIVYYDVESMSGHLQRLVEDTFTNWLAQLNI